MNIKIITMYFTLCVSTISWRHDRQKVCWQGSTLEELSSCSRQTEHSRASLRSNVGSISNIFKQLAIILTSWNGSMNP